MPVLVNVEDLFKQLDEMIRKVELRQSIRKNLPIYLYCGCGRFYTLPPYDGARYLSCFCGRYTLVET